MSRYTQDEIAAQCAAVDTYLAEHRSHRWIAEKLGIGLATVSERRRALAETAERQDIGDARLVRQEATQGARRWLQRVEEGYERDEIGLEAAGKLAAKWWDLIVRWNGAALPYRVAVESSNASATAPELPAQRLPTALWIAQDPDDPAGQAPPAGLEGRALERWHLRHAARRDIARGYWQAMSEGERDTYDLLNGPVPDWLHEPMETKGVLLDGDTDDGGRVSGAYGR